MSHNSENLEVKSEASSKSDELDKVSQDNGQDKSSTTVASHDEARLNESSEKNDDFKETSQEKSKPVDFGQQVKNSTESNQMKTNSTQSNQQNVDSTEQRQQNIEPTEPSQDKYEEREGSENETQLNQMDQKAQSSSQPARYFDLNLKYLVQVRGIANITHIILSLAIVVLLGLNCSESERFHCKPLKMFLFIVSCSSFFTAAIYFFCCVTSKNTNFLMSESSFEVGYFTMYFLFVLTAGLSLLVSGMNEESSKIKNATIIGLINGFVYGFSAIWFFFRHCTCKQEEQINENQNIPQDRSEGQHPI